MNLIDHIHRHTVQRAKDFTRSGTTKLRSPHWPAARRWWLKGNPKCAACGGTEGVQVHHVQPFHLFPEKELDPANFITLCEMKGERGCHLKVGHRIAGMQHGNWRFNNPRVREDAASMIAASVR